MTNSVEQAIGGGQALDDLLKTLPAKLQKNITTSGLRAGAAVLLKEVRRLIPVDQGNLKRTARISVRKHEGQVFVSVKVGGKHKGVDAYYAHMVEYGTKKHYIKVPDAERGTNRRTGRLVAMATVNKRVLQIGGNFVGPSVLHPGAKKTAFMRPAVDAKFIESVNAVREKIRERLAKQGLNVPDPTPIADGDE